MRWNKLERQAVVKVTGRGNALLRSAPHMNTPAGMSHIIHDLYDIDGIRVERFRHGAKDPDRRPPLICVHGGCHASWSWQEHAAVYAAAAYEVHALNWRGRAVRQRSTMTRS